MQGARWVLEALGQVDYGQIEVMGMHIWIVGLLNGLFGTYARRFFNFLLSSRCC